MRHRNALFAAAVLSTCICLLLTIGGGGNGAKLIKGAQSSTHMNPAGNPSRRDASGTKNASLKAQARASNIIKILHQSWKTRQLPARAVRWSASWKSCFPDWEWRLWTDQDNVALVRDHYAWFLPVYNGQRYNIERADLARYFYLYHFGGIYTDLDTVCMKNFEHLLHLETLVFGAMDTHPGDSVLPGQLVQNSFMASLRPGHPFWMRLLRRIERNFNAGKRGRPEDNTGPTVLMEELRLYVRSNASDVKVYPGKYFNPFSWTLRNSKICKDFGQMSDSVEKICINSFPKAFVVQLHTQSWGRGRMR